MISEVEKNQDQVSTGDVLFYSDASNAQKWTVMEVFDGGFQATDGEEIKDFYFSALQSGWSFSEKTVERKRIDNRMKFRRQNKAMVQKAIALGFKSILEAQNAGYGKDIKAAFESAK